MKHFTPSVEAIALVQAILDAPDDAFDEIPDPPVARPRVRVASIIRATAKRFNVAEHDMLSARRTKNLALPRQVAMYIARLVTWRSLPEIGRHMGAREHTTILHGCRKIAAMVEAGDPIIADIEAIRAELGASA